MKFLMLIIITIPCLMSSVILLSKMFGYINLSYWMVFTSVISTTVAIYTTVAIVILVFSAVEFILDLITQ